MLITESQYSDNSMMIDKKNSAVTDKNNSKTTDFENFLQDKFLTHFLQIIIKSEIDEF